MSLKVPLPKRLIIAVRYGGFSTRNEVVTVAYMGWAGLKNSVERAKYIASFQLRVGCLKCNSL